MTAADILENKTSSKFVILVNQEMWRLFGKQGQNLSYQLCSMPPFFWPHGRQDLSSPTRN